MAFEHFRWDMLWSAITSQMLQLLYQSLITVFGEVHCGLVSQTGIKQGLGQKQNVCPLDVLQNCSWSRTSLISLWEISIWPWIYKLLLLTPHDRPVSMEECWNISQLSAFLYLIQKTQQSSQQSKQQYFECSYLSTLYILHDTAQ